MPRSTLDLFVEDLIREHALILKELRHWRQSISSGPDLQNVKKFTEYYYSRIAVHAKLEEENLPLRAEESGEFLDTEAFVFSHENLDLHCRVIEERLETGNPLSKDEQSAIIREVTELCDLIENHFQEEEHHLFPRDMEEIYESSGAG
jgi:hemerythrin-like domain-containing protein